ncbi:hypothetical protein NS263_00625 [Curtobacterium oceanosedimentum]|uniref:DNA helicase n=2 Tax=Curtobacterium oceanosedimentum TaxID=465820 RepID=A0ABR5SA64_9MICO|nr:hypothetical protein NS263_00625 [Curtobacterium oceanosedimentum]
MSPGEQYAFNSSLPGGTDVNTANRELFLTDGLVAFDYFADWSAEVLENFPLIRKAYAAAYPIIMLDEFQDTVDPQWRLLQNFVDDCALVALGDPNQRMYDWLPGANEHRFDEFMDVVSPAVFDLSAWNWRSPEGSIAQFGQDVLVGVDIIGENKLDEYDAVDIVGMGYPPLSQLKWLILAALKRQRESNGSVAVLTPTNQLSQQVWDYMTVAQSAALPALRMELVSDQEDGFAAAVFLAAVLEQPDAGQMSLAAVCRAMATYLQTRSERLSQAAAKVVQTLRQSADTLEAGVLRAERVAVRRLRLLLETSLTRARSGHPFADFLMIASIARDSEDKEIARAGRSSRTVNLVSRGSDVEVELGRAWRNHGRYVDSARILRDAIVAHQMTAARMPVSDLVVMNVHRSKGKEFDEVIVYEEKYTRFARENASIEVGRRALHVAITRARARATFATPQRDPSVLLSGARGN